MGRVFTTDETVIKIPSGDSPIASITFTCINIDCWNTSDRDLTLEKCGPSAPLHLTVDILLVNESSVVMTINWRPPPTYDTSFTITLYKIVINNITILIANQTHYQLTSDAVKKYVVKVYKCFSAVY